MTIALYASFVDSPVAFYCETTITDFGQQFPRLITDAHREGLSPWPNIFWPDADCWVVFADSLEEAKHVALLRWIATTSRYMAEDTEYCTNTFDDLMDRTIQGAWDILTAAKPLPIESWITDPSFTTFSK